MNLSQKKLVAFLIGNMKSMETELRAQSIVLDALAKKLITVDDLEHALPWARNSTEMLDLVKSKYGLLEIEAAEEGDARKQQLRMVH